MEVALPGQWCQETMQKWNKSLHQCRQVPRRKKKKKRKKHDKGELQDEAQAEDEAPAEETKKKKRRKRKKPLQPVPDLLKPYTHTEMLEIDSSDEKQQDKGDEAKNLAEKQQDEEQNQEKEKEGEQKSNNDEEQIQETQEVDKNKSNNDEEQIQETQEVDNSKTNNDEEQNPRKAEDGEPKHETVEKDEKEDQVQSGEMKDTKPDEEKPEDEDDEDYEEEVLHEEEDDPETTVPGSEQHGDPGTVEVAHAVAAPTPPSMPLQPRPPLHAPPAAWKGKKGKNYEKGQGHQGGKARGKGKGKNHKGSKGRGKGKPGSHGYYVWDGWGNSGYVDSWGQLQPFLVSYCYSNFSFFQSFAITELNQTFGIQIYQSIKLFALTLRNLYRSIKAKLMWKSKNTSNLHNK